MGLQKLIYKQVSTGWEVKELPMRCVPLGALFTRFLKNPHVIAQCREKLTHVVWAPSLVHVCSFFAPARCGDERDARKVLRVVVRHQGCGNRLC